MALSTTFTQRSPASTKFGKITQNTSHFSVQGHSRSPILVPVETIARQVGLYCALSLEFMNPLRNFHLAVIEYLYRGRRAVPLQTFTTRQFSMDVNGRRMAKVPNGKKSCRKFQPAE